MEFLIASVDHLEFKIERDLNQQFGALPLPFPGMDKSTAAVCQFFNGVDGSECDKGASCPFRHIRGGTIVCKHWLRGLCKKGDQCEFLHEYDMTKMPECYFYSRFNACHNKECPFLHIDPESKIKDCPWYDRGFCRHGPHCRHRHVRRVLCMNYLAGFCPDGHQCKYMHPRFELPPPPEIPKDQIVKRPPTCHYCGELGHKASGCSKMPPEQKEATIRQEEARFKALSYFKQQHHREQQQIYQQQLQGANENGNNENHNDRSQSESKPPNPKPAPKPLEEITCFKCGNKGHYANKCPKGHLAFLSNRNQQS
ncbi:cleavage and polyadenylation specificity factor subunit 4 [Condylostylus longicornis]|uniref:cleavage and polyadenylation specificity factor subunit 4 n=1 Tax=Condylostylus longicornis TaxID=2530218 RepID=UPI00244DB7D7|nr:cleavage and polyadenylation specificity factor subunit 4 [Condylostylus longicornis]